MRAAPLSPPPPRFRRQGRRGLISGPGAPRPPGARSALGLSPGKRARRNSRGSGGGDACRFLSSHGVCLFYHLPTPTTSENSAAGEEGAAKKTSDRHVIDGGPPEDEVRAGWYDVAGEAGVADAPTHGGLPVVVSIIGPAVGYPAVGVCAGRGACL
mmetsp:Transcript_8063/g.16758  ORF Transcript_8063/g.16758 Transcript_8063/m.16758 type:complete len:156 (-) Transcript_8063:141-608(-)